jgi:hypothetical protein
VIYKYTDKEVFLHAMQRAVIPNDVRNLHGAALKTPPCGRGDTDEQC